MGPKKPKSKRNIQKTRKELRKEKRQQKKQRRNEYYTKKKKPEVLLHKTNNESLINQEKTKKSLYHSKPNLHETTVNVEVQRAKEKKQQMNLEKEMKKRRKKQLLEANLEEDQNIKRLEKQLKLNKRKSKSVPASFTQDGLDYLLEICDLDDVKNPALAEAQLAETNDEFEEDLQLVTEGGKSKKRTNNVQDAESIPLKRRKVSEEDSNFEDENTDESPEEDEEEDTNIEDEAEEEAEESEEEKLPSETWEDIYGRLRTKDGSIINDKNERYIPPAARTGEKNEKLTKLKRQLKGLINRLAESNMHSISKQIEELYMSHSRNDMNTTITDLVLDALVTNILAPERLLMEHVLLIIILHANVGTEVGAHFLQRVIQQFHRSRNEGKKLDNLVLILAQLYNFKMFESKLIYEIINSFVDAFDEKSVECILHILRNVGFNLRKDDPIALRNLILALKKKSASAPDTLKDNSRVKFMLDILLAIKNNNVTKIPNYDTTYSEHLKKTLKSFIRKGNYVTQLNISFQDLLKVDDKGKWWVVGSAWHGHEDTQDQDRITSSTSQFSQKLLDLAKKQRMNTDTRKNIFCIIMSAEDYLDAFEKLLRLSLKNDQEREIINVILHCCLQEKSYNPYYATLAQKFCEYNRKFQMSIKFSVWGKLKALEEHSATQISHLAKLLAHLFIEKGLSISTLKIVHFGELDKVTLRFIRQILLIVLLHKDVEICKAVFEKISQSEKLKLFRESLRLFFHHFLLKNLDAQKIGEDKKALLQERVKVVEKLLLSKNFKEFF